MQITNAQNRFICNTHLTKSLNNCAVNIVQTDKMSLPIVSPIYYTPNFKGNCLDDEQNIDLTEEEFEALKEELKTLDQKETFDRLNIKYEEDEEGNITLEHFMCPIYKSDRRIEMNDLELDIDKLFNNVVEIKNDVDLNRCKFSPFKTLKHIGGDLYCTFADVKSLGSLEKVDGVIYADGSNLEDLGALQEAYYISLDYAKNFKSISNLKKARMCLNYTQVTDVSSLEECYEMSAIGCPLPQEQKERIIKLTNGNCNFG